MALWRCVCAMYLQDDGAVSGLADDQLAGVAVAWETSFRGEQGSWILLIIEEVARLEQSGFFIFSQRRLWRAQGRFDSGALLVHNGGTEC